MLITNSLVYSITSCVHYQEIWENKNEPKPKINLYIHIMSLDRVISHYVLHGQLKNRMIAGSSSARRGGNCNQEGREDPS